MAEARPVLYCDICREGSRSNEAIALCKECKELYCIECVSCHRSFSATEKHTIVNATMSENISCLVAPECDTCYRKDKCKLQAISLCVDCREFYCNSCTQRHVRFKATNSHVIHRLAESTFVVKSVSTNSIHLSSDFVKFTKASDNTFVRAQAPVLPSKFHCDIKYLDRKAMDRVSAKVVATFDGKIKNDQNNCKLEGIICLQDGRILLLDINNENIKMFDKKFKLICSKRTLFGCFSMTKVSEDEIAVVFRAKQTVNFYTITKDEIVLQDKVFKLDGEGYGISFNGDIYAIACASIVNWVSFIQLCSQDGQDIRRITLFKYRAGLIINLDSENDNIYVQAKAGSKFSCLSHQGELKWEMDFCGHDVIELYNCILVTSCSDNAIMLCTKDGGYRKLLIHDKHNLCHPEYMAYNSETQQIFVTRYKSNDVVVMQLSF